MKREDERVRNYDPTGNYGEALKPQGNVYARRSSQLPEEPGGRNVRLNQLQLVRQYGWLDHLIVLIAEDMGKPAFSVHRSGYQRMLDQIMTGGVGAIFAASVCRCLGV